MQAYYNVHFSKLIAFKYGLRRCEEPKQDGIFRSIWQYKLEGDYKVRECIIEIHAKRRKFRSNRILNKNGNSTLTSIPKSSDYKYA